VTRITDAPSSREHHGVMPDKLWYLQRLNLFEEMGEAEIQAISRELRMRSCAQGAPFATGEHDRVYLLKAGRMRLYHLTEEGQEVTTAVLEPGQLFGLGALIGGDGWATHAEPIEDSVVCDASAADFVGMLARHPVLMARVLMVMARQMFRLQQRIESIASQPVSGRLAALLLEHMADGERTEGGVLLPHVTHDDLAKIVDSSRESVSRTLARWRAEGIVESDGRRVVVVDPERLRLEAQTRR
jgi:CRP/FNR family transcriptional regulator, cyclic AMP receptor protein